MSYSLIQSAQNEGTSPQTATFGSTPTAGNLLVATFKKNSQTTSSVSDSGTAWTEASVSPFNFNTTSSSMRLFYKLADSGQATAVVTSGTGTHFLSIYEFSGNQASLTGIESAAVAYSQGGSDANDNYAGIEVTPADDNCLVIAQIGLASTITSPIWNNASSLQSNKTGLIQLIDGYVVQTTAALVRPYATWTTNRIFGAITIAFKPAASGASATVTQVAANITAAGGTQTVATVNFVALTQLAGTVTASGGNQVITTIQDVSIAQIAANVTASGGTQTIATVNNVTISQLAGIVTASGGTQTISTGSVVSASITQVAGTITASGGTQAIATINNVVISQVAATVTVTGGTQTIATSNFVSIAQVAATITASGGVPVISTSTGPLPPSRRIILVDGKYLALKITGLYYVRI